MEGTGDNTFECAVRRDSMIGPARMRVERSYIARLSRFCRFQSSAPGYRRPSVTMVSSYADCIAIVIVYTNPKNAIMPNNQNAAEATNGGM